MDPTLLERMLDPTFYPRPTSRVEHLQTHISHIFLTQDRAYKVKKPVNFGFLDFSTLEKRIHFSFQEVTLNSRLSPGIYLGVRGLGRIDDQWKWLEPDDQHVEEVAIEMIRLPQEGFLHHLIMKDQVPHGAIDKIAEKVALFHQETPADPSKAILGMPEKFKENTDENFHQTKEFINLSISESQWKLIKEKTEEFYKTKGSIMRKRAREGNVKDCHGDLHSQHICLWKDKVYIFDCIEFNERFRYGDVASEVAFLMMDLEFLMKPQLAQAFLDRYLEVVKDETLTQVLDFYKCYRAFVRGKVESFRLKDPFIPHAEKLKALLRAHRYFFLAEDYAQKMV